MTLPLKVNARLGAVRMLNLALFSAAFALRYPDVPTPIRIFQAIVPADPLAAELTRCQKLGFEAVGNPSCEEAFIEGGARFFSPPKKSLER